MSKITILSILGLFIILGCDKISHFTNEKKSDLNQNVNVGSSALKSVTSKLCADGQSPQVLKGLCTGKWLVAKTSASSTCQFDWGPTVKCPEKTKAMGTEAACYGSTYKAIPANSSIQNANDCAKAFGETPEIASYEMQCCPT